MLNKKIQNMTRTKFPNRRQALRELKKYPGNQVVEKDGKYYLEYNPPLLNNTGKSEMRRVLSGRILPKWIPFLLLEILGIRTLLIWQISFEQAVVYLNLGSY